MFIEFNNQIACLLNVRIFQCEFIRMFKLILFEMYDKLYFKN